MNPETPLNYEQAEKPCGCGNPWVLKLWAGWECGNGHALPLPPPEPIDWGTSRAVSVTPQMPPAWAIAAIVIASALLLVLVLA